MSYQIVPEPEQKYPEDEEVEIEEKMSAEEKEETDANNQWQDYAVNHPNYE